jgi:carboxypeptidase C (cathepsin A)
MRQAEEWTDPPYTSLLAQGDRVPAAERAAAAETLAGFTGLRAEFIERAGLRISMGAFCKELLREANRTVGRLDSRFKGIDAEANAERPDHDPSLVAIRPPYTAAFNDYVRRELGYETDQPYHILGGGFEKWDWGPVEDGTPDTSEALRQALAKNPHMKVFVASGYYDLATPYFATTYTLNHMGLDPALRANFTTADYEAGHMMYIHEPCLEQFKRDAAAFIAKSR